ncbi:galactitol-specific PTS system IIB component [Ligilactobacillus salitolerans]|uniref:Galactitol-specific PTS system IIB component n=1 Tax=Ligilactobacillus salitolerans TaxID=1808352 RepID=A0A401IVZ3_9LACO|nr:PTS galactitol transporter subunit IIB [Ligilactobacillus salitolerans]GBG95689.1 galactitol-specific PTS system IIB component [Ligilactobacillus salitolerans]
MLKIVVACGSGVATSETVVGSIKSFLEEHSVSGVEVEATDFKQLASVLANYDVYVWLAKPTPEIQEICDEEGIPDVNGVDLLTGAKGDQTYLDLVNALMSLKNAS